MNFIIAASTDIGNVKGTNQDSYSARVITTKLGKMVFAVLCDGMGGFEKGEVASATLVNAFNRWCESRLPELCEQGINDNDIQNDWISIVTVYNEKIKNYGKRNGIKLGTTVTAILITDTKYYIINVGDTRAYEIKENVNILTNDQTVVAREVALGIITEEEAKVDPRRSVLLQCVGALDTVSPDIFVGYTTLNSVYMLCSDGFRHEISEKEIYEYLNHGVMLDADRMKRNMDSLIEIVKQRKERDNITVISVRTF